MSKSGVEATTNKAQEQEKKWDWLGAAKSYEVALGSEGAAALSAAETWKRVGFCYGRASRQTENVEDFRVLTQQAVDAYRRAAELFEKEGGLESRGRSAECSALASYLGSWLASNPEEKRRTLDECRGFGRESLEIYEKAGDQLSYGKMCNNLLVCLFERLQPASDWREMESVSKEGMDYAQKALVTLSKLENKKELSQAYSLASLLNWYAANISEQEEKRKEHIRRSLSYTKKALELLKEVDDPYIAAMTNWAAAMCTLFFTDKIESALEYAKDMSKNGITVRDKYLMGVASYVLAFVTDLMIRKEEDPEKRKEARENAIKYAEDAVSHLQLVSQEFYIAEAYQLRVENYSYLAREVEIDPEKKQSSLEKAVEIGREGLQYAISSGSPDATGFILHALSKALHFNSKIETGKSEKRLLLEEALTHRQEYIKIVEKAFPSNNWILGIGKIYEGLINADLARLEADKERIPLLQRAIADMKDGLSRTEKWISSHRVPQFLATVATFQYELGEMLDERSHLAEDITTLAESVEVYKNAAKKFKEADLPSRTAESYWKVARSQDKLGMHLEAAYFFDKASAEYMIAAPKISQFSEFYLEHSTYMKAWSEIERAKFAHKKQEYKTAMKHYRKTADLLKQSERWDFMSPNFLAWAFLESAEDMSRNGRINEALEAFKEAAKLYEKANEAFVEETEKIKIPEEKEKAIELGKASTQRRDYCTARINVEEARIHDQQGSYGMSAEKYSQAASTFEKLLETAEKSDQKEIETTALMCRAWQKMKTADDMDSAELFHEASELFLRVKESSSKHRTILVASGNSVFCKALEFGTRFEATRDGKDFSKVKEFLSGAANYYLKADFQSASLWTSATEVLFDAYNYMSVAEVEAEPEKKARLFLLAEKCLERSAGLFESAGYTGKRDEVRGILDKVKEKREFAVSLREFLTTPTEVSSTSVISAPSSPVEEPVGLSKFEGALVEANLIVPKTKVVYGQSVQVEVHVANLGKSAAFLTRMEGIIPEGFDLIEKPQKATGGDGYLNLKGSKLDALQTEEMQLTFKPRKKGKFVFQPRISFINEAGEHQSCELEQKAINVEEIGIRGWLRGPQG